MKNIVKNLVTFLLVFAIVATIFSLYSTETEEIDEVGIATLVS